jgi:hypothetical protein
MQELGFIVGAVVVVIAMLTIVPLVAARKGFVWPYWILAAGCLGLLIVLVLPSANAPDLSPEERERRRQTGKNVGIGFTIFTILVITVRTLMSFVEDANEILEHQQTRPVAAPTGPVTWQSAHHGVQLTTRPPWSMIGRPKDRPDELGVALIDERDGTSYLIRVIAVEPDEAIGEGEWQRETRKVMLEHNPANELIDERYVPFHRSPYYRMRFKMRAEKWGTMCVAVHMRRTPTRSILVQWQFPFDEDAVNEERIPAELAELDASVYLPN